MSPITFLVIMHGMAAIALLVWALKYHFGIGSAWKWGLSGLLLGMIPFGILSWKTRYDWGFFNKLIGLMIVTGFEAGIRLRLFAQVLESMTDSV